MNIVQATIHDDPKVNIEDHSIYRSIVGSLLQPIGKVFQT